MSRRASLFLYVSSLLFHGIAGVALAGMDGTRPPPEVTRITMRSVPPRPVEEELPPPPEPEPELAEPEPIARPAPAEAPPPTQAPTPAAPVDFGVALGNLGPGGPGGIAVPVGDPGGQQVPRVTRTAEREVAQAAPQPRESGGTGCAEPDTRPRPLSMPRPSYTEAARAAAIEGRVRIEINVDESGNITGKRVVASLGHGLDEAALSAVESARFEPAMRCGTAISSTFVLSVRFTL